MTMWDPMRDMESIRREMDRIFSGDGIRSQGRMPHAFLPGRAARQYPLVNLYDDGDNMYVEALAPGIEPSQLEVTVTGSTLTISGQKPGPEGVAPERMHRSERAAGRFMRTLQLPSEVERDRVDAEYANGLILMKMPRAESAKPRRIMIRADNSEGNQGNQISDQGKQVAS